MSVLTIIIIVIIVIVVVLVAAACVIKFIQERRESHLYTTQSNSEEMIDVLRDEQSLGRSTPPMNAYHDGHDYKAVNT